MQATIELTEISTGIVINDWKYEREETAQNEFDVFTSGGNEWQGKYQWDLIAHTPKNGDCCRRTMYTN